METKSLNSSVEPLIARLYRSGLLVRAGNFRAWALRELRRVIPFDGALWGTGSMQRRQFHTVVTVDLPPDFPETLEATHSINPILPRILQQLDQPVDMSSVLPDEEFFDSPVYHECFERFGISRILSTAHANDRSGLYSLLTLYRNDREQRFTEQEMEDQARISFHLFQSAAHHYFVHLSQTFHGERAANSAAAVVDREGVYYEAQAHFLDLVEKHFPSHRQFKLPFELPDPGEVTCVNDLCLKCEPFGDLTCILAWSAGPLDRLTEREREIVFAITQGLSFKQAARRIGVAPSTVANHLYRIYRKLGVNSRTELATLVYPQDNT